MEANQPSPPKQPVQPEGAQVDAPATPTNESGVKSPVAAGASELQKLQADGVSAVEGSAPEMPESVVVVPNEVAALSGSIGKRFKAAREAKHLSVAEIANRLKRGVRQIEALEAEDYANLPGTTHLRGFVRAYAGAVGLSSETMVALLPLGSAAPAAAAPTTPAMRNAARAGVGGGARNGESLNPRRLDAPFPQPGEARMADRGWLMASLAVVLLAVGYGLYAWLVPVKLKAPTAGSAAVTAAKAPEPVGPAGAAPSALSSPTSIALPSVEPAGIPIPLVVPQAEWQTEGALSAGDASKGGRLRMVFSKESWVQVLDGSGAVVHLQTHKPGDEKFIAGAPPFSLIIGKAADVQLFFDGKRVDLSPHIRDNAIARLTLP